MKLKTLFLASLLVAPVVFAEPTEWKIDFGKSAYNSGGGKYMTRTAKAGWNNVSATGTMSGNLDFDAWDEETQWFGTKWDNQYFDAPQYTAGKAELANVFFAETVEGSDASDVKGAHEEWAVKEISVYDSKANADSVLKLSVNKDTDTGYMDTIYSPSSGWNVTEDEFSRFGSAIPDNVPSTAYGDFIYGYGGATYTVTLTGFAEGYYDITVLGGMCYSSGGKTPSVAYTLNGETLTLTGDDSGRYAGVMTWQNVYLGVTDSLVLSIEGLLGDTGYGSSEYTTAALNAMIISEAISGSIPEPASATLSLLALVGLSLRRRRK